MSDLLNVGEAAEDLRLSPHTLRGWIFKRRLPFVKLGKRVLLRRKDLDEAIRKGYVAACSSNGRGEK
jgi:excisionase family DNA binding protein